MPTCRAGEFVKKFLVLSISAALIAAAASGTPIIVTDPIPVNGSGELEVSPGLSFISEIFSGTNGIDSVFMSAQGLAEADGVGYGTSYNEDDFSGTARVDGPGGGFGGPYFSFSLLGDPGSITINDSTDNPLITAADLIETVVVDCIIYNDPAPFSGYTEYFSITSIPEPATVWLVLMALILIISKRLPKTQKVLIPR
jgi:hypothetical protein